MKNLFLLLAILLTSSCSAAVEVSKNKSTSVFCEFKFTNLSPCRLGDLVVELKTKKVNGDEVLITSISIVKNQSVNSLTLSSEISIIDGDTGYIKNKDINFDGYADIAITTSFGTPNLYFDYWVYDTKEEGFIYVGNYGDFDIDIDKKILLTNEKINAANYKKSSYQWQGNTLISK